MYSNVEILKYGKQTTVTISPQKSLIYKLTVSLIAILILVLPIAATILFLTRQIKADFEVLLFVGINLVLLIFVYKHLRSTFRKEIITIENNKFTYNNSFLGLGKYFETNLNKIKTFKHIGYGQQTKHPLDIKGDVFGFGAQEREINYLNQTGTMILATEFDVLKFGADVDEEDYYKIKGLFD